MNDYPHWICAPCGEKRGKTLRAFCTTWHDPDPKDSEDHCGWCGSTARALTEPRDYGYPPAPKIYPKVVDLRGKGYA